MSDKIEEYYARQYDSGALVNINNEAYLIAKGKHKKAMSDKQRLDNLEANLCLAVIFSRSERALDWSMLNCNNTFEETLFAC